MSRPGQTAPRKRSGFTLIELLIVLFLGTLILGLTAMLFGQSLEAGRLQATARELSATIRQARALTRINDIRQVVFFDLDAREYGLEGYRPKKIPPQVHLKVLDPYQGEIRQGRYTLIVEPNRGLEGGLFQLSSKKRSVQIQIDPILGSTVVR
jgi:prepilin-type N-terminal cleavage/methylation domain-containing protein